MSAGAPVVSNAGPLMALAKLNLLHLLKALYGHVYFARSVYDETVVEGIRQGHEDARTLRLFLDQMGWHPDEVGPADMPPDLREVHLDQGERDTLALAERLHNFGEMARRQDIWINPALVERLLSEVLADG